MKRLIALLLVAAMCLGLFAGCRKDDGADTTPSDTGTTAPSTAPEEVPGEDYAVADAAAYVKAMYKDADESTPRDYTVISSLPIGGVTYTITWSVDVSEDIVKVVVGEDGTVTIDVNEALETETPYVLTATITDPAGNSETVSFNRVVPAVISGDATEIVDMAYALEPGESLPNEATLTGEIISVNTPYDSGYKNITVTIAVSGREDKPIMCYRLKGDGADTLTIGDTITVTGILTNYNGTIEFTSGCILVSIIKGDGVVPVAPDSMQEIVDEAYGLSTGASLAYYATLTGVITKINTPYDAGYNNITVTIAVSGRESKPIVCYRLKGEGADQLTVGDTITVTGVLTNYNGTIEFTSGCTLDSVVKGGGTVPTAPSDPKAIVDAAYKLDEGNSLPYYATLTGVITSIDDPYSTTYNNITVTMVVSGRETKPIVCFRLKGDGADKLAVGDTITVTGILTNYYGTIEFTSGCTLDKVVKGDGTAPVTPSTPSTPSTTTETVSFVNTPAAGVAYKLVLQQNNKNGVILGFAGEMDGFYYGTSETVSEMVDVYLEKTTGGYYLYFLNGTTKTYLDIVPRDTDASKTNVVLQTSGTHSVYTLNTEYQYIYTTVNGADWYFGTYNTYATISASSTSYITGDKAANIGVSQFCAWFGLVTEKADDNTGDTGNTDDNTGNEDDTTEPTDPDVPTEPTEPEVPTDPEEIVKAAYALESGESLDYTATLTGVITKIDTPYDSGYKNITVTIQVGDLADYPIMCFRLKGDGAADLAVGDTITVTGTLTNYNSTIEFKSGCTLDAVVKALTPEEIVKAAYELAAGESLDYTATLTGVITKIDTPYDSGYKNITVTIQVGDLADYPIMCFRLKGDGAADLAVGDTITVTGTLTNYNDTIEFKSGCTLDAVVKAESGEDTTDPDEDEEEVVIPTDPKEIVKAAYALGIGEALPYEATLTGTITKIDTAYSEQYGNITVTIQVGDLADYPIMCFRLKGDGIADLAVGDAITVTGTITNYSGTIEFTSGCLMTARTAAADLAVIDAAYELESGASMSESVTLTGVITTINTAYSSQYGNITVTIAVLGREDKPIMCYRLKGTGADTLAVGDTITVTGTITNYNGTIEFGSGCTLDAVVKGENDAAVAPEDPAEIVKAAYALGTGESLPYEATLTGTITKIDTAYSEQYGNITVTIQVGDLADYPIVCYRLKGTGADALAVGDTITVTGTITNYNGTIEFGSGCTLDAVVSAGSSTGTAETAEEAKEPVTVEEPAETTEGGE